MICGHRRQGIAAQCSSTTGRPRVPGHNAGQCASPKKPSGTTGADTPLPAKLWAVTVPTVQVRDVADVDRPWLRELVASMWGLPVVTSVRAYEHPERLDGSRLYTSDAAD
jgi:hypothetical protein